MSLSVPVLDLSRFNAEGGGRETFLAELREAAHGIDAERLRALVYLADPGNFAHTTAWEGAGSSGIGDAKCFTLPRVRHLGRSKYYSRIVNVHPTWHTIPPDTPFTPSNPAPG